MKRGDFSYSSGFGWRWGAPHNGLDLATAGGAFGLPYFAAHDGVVVRSGPASGFGHWIVIDGQDSVGFDSVYGHSYASGLLVRAGDTVKAGDLIGLVGSDGGSTGPHLHFELWSAPGRFGGSPVDPAPLLAGRPFAGDAPLAPAPAAPEVSWWDALSDADRDLLWRGLAQWSGPHTNTRS
jgi:murein DD-endopeptidase MepM/ murein hydrolase activator NlpD